MSIMFLSINCIFNSIYSHINHIKRINKTECTAEVPFSKRHKGMLNTFVVHTDSYDRLMAMFISSLLEFLLRSIFRVLYSIYF